MSPNSTPSTADGAGGSSSKTPSAMLEHYLDSAPEIFERLSPELSASTAKSEGKVAEDKIKEYLVGWDKAWVNAGKSDSK